MKIKTFKEAPTKKAVPKMAILRKEVELPSCICNTEKIRVIPGCVFAGCDGKELGEVCNISQTCSMGLKSGEYVLVENGDIQLFLKLAL